MMIIQDPKPKIKTIKIKFINSTLISIWFLTLISQQIAVKIKAENHNQDKIKKCKAHNFNCHPQRTKPY
jgi:hypothetical protein